MDTASVYSDFAGNTNPHTGAYNELYPYQAGVYEFDSGALMGWAWGISRIVDAIKNDATGANQFNLGLGSHRGDGRLPQRQGRGAGGRVRRAHRGHRAERPGRWRPDRLQEPDRKSQMFTYNVPVNCQPDLLTQRARPAGDPEPDRVGLVHVQGPGLRSEQVRSLALRPARRRGARRAAAVHPVDRRGPAVLAGLPELGAIPAGGRRSVRVPRRRGQHRLDSARRPARQPGPRPAGSHRDHGQGLRPQPDADPQVLQHPGRREQRGARRQRRDLSARRRSPRSAQHVAATRSTSRTSTCSGRAPASTSCGARTRS